MNWNKYPETVPPNDGKYLVVVFLNSCYRVIDICNFASNLRKADKYSFPNERRAGWYQYDSEWGYFERSDITHWAELPPMPNDY